MSESNRNLADLIGAATVLSLPIVNPELDRPYAIVPETFRVHDLESYMPQPKRVQATTEHRSVESFLNYVERFSTKENTVIFAVVDGDAPKFTAYLDYHESAEDPTWCDHIAVLNSVASPEWQAWRQANKKQFNQREFALFIEDNSPDIVEPSSADMLSISRSIIAKKSVDFSSDIRLDNGQVQFKYVENIQGSMQQGTLSIPEKFKLQIPVFQGGEVYQLEARFRYSLADGGKLTLSYDLWRAHKIIEAAAKRVIVQIKERFPLLPIYVGSVSK